MLDSLTNSGSLPVLERLARFTEARHRAITHNIANLDTPNFRPINTDPAAFQTQMRDAVERRRHGGGDIEAGCGPNDAEDFYFADGGLEHLASFGGDNILFHDRNNRDLERQMQDLVENTLTHNAAIDLMKSEFDLIRTAIRERV